MRLRNDTAPHSSLKHTNIRPTSTHHFLGLLINKLINKSLCSSIMSPEKPSSQTLCPSTSFEEIFRTPTSMVHPVSKGLLQGSSTHNFIRIQKWFSSERWADLLHFMWILYRLWGLTGFGLLQPWVWHGSSVQFAVHELRQLGYHRDSLPRRLNLRQPRTPMFIVGFAF